MPEEQSGPYLQMAVFCEKVLQEASGVVSLIRIVDQMQVAGPFEEMQPTPINVQAVLSFKAGMARGKYRIKLRGTSPSGKELPAVEMAPYFEGEDRGVNLVLGLNLVLQEEGVFWFDVLLEDAVVTRIPFRILYQRVAGPAAPEGSS